MSFLSLVRAFLLSLCLAYSGAARVETWHTSGRSMLPTLPVERTPIKVMPASDPLAWLSVSLGSVVIVAHDGELTCHRVIAVIAPGVYWTKGDNNALPDPFYCTRANFAALVLTPLPRAKR